MTLAIFLPETIKSKYKKKMLCNVPKMIVAIIQIITLPQCIGVFLGISLSNLCQTLSFATKQPVAR
jgi:hypothetical protein